jgi:hypothetical protein
MIYGTQEFDDYLIKLIKGSKDNKHRHSCYEAACEHATEMSWHIYGVTPEELLNRVRPNEPPEVTKYRLENYEPTTKSAADKALQVVSKIFNPNLSSVRWKNQNPEAEELKSYTLEYYPVYNSVVNYMQSVVLRRMIADPNGVLVAKLAAMPELSTERVKPTLIVYGCESVWSYDYDHYLIYLHTENENGINWFYFEYYDRPGYVSFRASISPTDQLSIQELEGYAHNFTEIPVWHLGGKSEALPDGTIIYKSFFDSAVPFWNLAIIHNSELLGCMVNHIYPQKYEISEPCTYRWDWEGIAWPCRGGRIKYGKDEHSHEMDCPQCSGSGYRNMAGSFGIYKISKEKLQEGDTPTGIDPVGYITVPIDAANMLKEHAAYMEKKGMWAINMEVEDEVGEVQSGVAKTIDRSAQYDTLASIAEVMFEKHLENAFYFFDQYMFGGETEKNLPEINKPTQFDLYSTADLILNFQAAKTAGLDPNFLQIKQEEILTRDLTTNTDLKQAGFLMLDLDPLPGLSDATVGSNVMRGFNREVDAVIHYNIKRFIERAFAEDKNFGQKQRLEQIEVLEGYGEEMITANKPKLDQTLLYGQNGPKNPKAPAA